MPSRHQPLTIGLPSVQRPCQRCGTAFVVMGRRMGVAATDSRRSDGWQISVGTVLDSRRLPSPGQAYLATSPDWNRVFCVSGSRPMYELFRRTWTPMAGGETFEGEPPASAQNR